MGASIEESRAPKQPRSAFLTYGFRPFFLLASLSAILTLAGLFGGLVLGLWPSEELPIGR